MATSATKSQFITNLQVASDALRVPIGTWADIVNYYFKNGFNGGGGNPIVAGDLAGTGLTVAQVTNGITMLQQLANFFGNQAVTTGDYQATVQALRIQ